MEKYVVNGGKILKGTIDISGAKNAAVAIIPATCIVKGTCIVDNVPDISDVKILLKILSSLGAKVKTINSHCYEIDSSNINSVTVPYDLAGSMRASYYFLGALLARFGEAHVAMPGGCDFGVRPIDQHIKGFEALGAKVTTDNGLINVNGERLEGTQIHFDVVSVGATMNVMMASIKAKGITVLENVAKEPHIVDLANFLNSMGADIRGAGTDVIKIHGVDMLHSTEYSIIPDQIEAGTYMTLAAAIGKDLKINGVIPKHMESITDKLKSIGATVNEFDDYMVVNKAKEINHINIKTLPHPGFPTDMQPQISAILTLSNGSSVISEGVWDNRFKYTSELAKMGASITVDGSVAVIEGVEKLHGAKVKATDLRAGAALVIAALMTKGTTEIEDILHIERGYENLIEKLQAVGADIKKIDFPDNEINIAN